jgi:hypothetical protein
VFYIKKNVGIVIILVVIFLAGAIILVKTNNASDDISLPAEEIHVQDGNGVEQHEFIPLERE